MASQLKSSLLYHNIWNYPLTKAELHKWSPGRKAMDSMNFSDHLPGGRVGLVKSEKFYALNKKSITSRLQNEKHSAPKLATAKKAANFLKFIPTIEFVGVTGSLAMKNAGKGSDIDLMIITKAGTLWTTRLITFFYLNILGFKLRRAGEREVANALCLNIWLDTSALTVPSVARNIYTAHELAQILPLVNKNNTFEHLIVDNSWIISFWPNAVELKNIKKHENSTTYPQIVFWPLEELAYRLQLRHMSRKRTREVVDRHKAFFHPKDWSREVERRLSSPPPLSPTITKTRNKLK